MKIKRSTSNPKRIRATLSSIHTPSHFEPWRTKRRDTRGERNVPFYETNPFYLCEVFDVSHLCTETYVFCSGVCKWVRSDKTNPFSGVYEGLGGYENGVVEKTNPKLPHT